MMETVRSHSHHSVSEAIDDTSHTNDKNRRTSQANQSLILPRKLCASNASAQGWPCGAMVGDCEPEPGCGVPSSFVCSSVIRDWSDSRSCSELEWLITPTTWFDSMRRAVADEKPVACPCRAEATPPGEGCVPEG